MKKLFYTICLALGLASVSQAATVSQTVTTNTGNLFTNTALIRSISIYCGVGTNIASFFKFYDSYSNSVAYTKAAYTNSSLVVSNLAVTNLGLYELKASGLVQQGAMYTNALGATNWESFPAGQYMSIVTNVVASSVVTFPQIGAPIIVSSNNLMTTLTFATPILAVHGLFYTNSFPCGSGQKDPADYGAQIIVDATFVNR